MSHVTRLAKKKFISPPPHVISGLQYEVIMGSVAYGVSGDTSDLDLYGFCIPTKAMMFPHLEGLIRGYDEPKPWEQYQKHHIKDPDALGGKGREYDVTVYNITKFFKLCKQNNPNMLDSLFVPENMITHCTQDVGRLVRDRRHIFLSQAIWHRYRGYAYSQLKKMGQKEAEGARTDLIEKHGYDVKFAYHLVRLLDEAEQFITTGDVDLQRDKERLKAIRAGQFLWRKLIAFLLLKALN